MAVDLPGRLRPRHHRLDYCRRRRQARRPRRARATGRPELEPATRTEPGQNCSRSSQVRVSSTAREAALEGLAVVAAPRCARRSRGRRTRPGRRRWRRRWRTRRTGWRAARPGATMKPQPRTPGPTRDGGLGAVAAVCNHRCAASSRPRATAPRPVEAELVGDRRDGVALLVVEVVLAREVRRDQPRVVLLGREQVAGTEVAGLDALAPRQPRGRHDGVVAGQQHDLVEGDRLRRDARTSVTDQRQPR